MGFSRGIANCAGLLKPLFLIILLGGIYFTNSTPEIVKKIVKPITILQLDNKLKSRDKTATIVSSYHYKTPNFNEVYKHTSSIKDLNTYLKTLDPYSKYLTSKEVIFFKERNKESRVGIGLNFLFKGEQVIGVPVEQGPAYQAGMVMPAYVHSINNHKIVYSDFSSYSFLTELPVGKVVQLALENSKNLNKTNYEIIAARHKNDPIIYHTYRDTFFIRIKKFKGGENSQLKEKLGTSKQYKKLVLDLRYCPGGDVYAMIDMLSFILQEDLNVVFLEKSNVQQGLTLKTLPGRVVAEIPLYILVSEFTASTAELFIWAIKKNYPKTSVLGENTKGKCLAQDMFQFDDGSALKLTAYEVKNSSNQSCQGRPFVPDKLFNGIALATTEEIFKILESINPDASEK